MHLCHSRSKGSNKRLLVLKSSRPLLGFHRCLASILQASEVPYHATPSCNSLSGGPPASSCACQSGHDFLEGLGGSQGAALREQAHAVDQEAEELELQQAPPQAQPCEWPGAVVQHGKRPQHCYHVGNVRP